MVSTRVEEMRIALRCMMIWIVYGMSIMMFHSVR